MTLSYLCSCAQSPEPIEYEKILGGSIYRQGERILSIHSVMAIVDRNDEASRMLKKAKTQQDIATIMSFAGGFAAGWPIGSFLGGGQPDWAIAVIGAGVLLVAIPLQIRANRKARRAIDIYNRSLQKDKKVGFLMNFDLSPGGLRVSMKF